MANRLLLIVVLNLIPHNPFLFAEMISNTYNVASYGHKKETVYKYKTNNLQLRTAEKCVVASYHTPNML